MLSVLFGFCRMVLVIFFIIVMQCFMFSVLFSWVLLNMVLVVFLVFLCRVLVFSRVVLMLGLGGSLGFGLVGVVVLFGLVLVVVLVIFRLCFGLIQQCLMLLLCVCLRLVLFLSRNLFFQNGWFSQVVLKLQKYILRIRFFVLIFFNIF